MLTGAQYRASLRDGRQVHHGGRRVEDVTADPLFGPAIDWASECYDRHHDPNPGAVGPYFEVPRTAADLVRQLELQRGWDTSTIITSESLLMVLTAGRRMSAQHPQYSERALAYYEDCRRRDLRTAFAITDAKGDRSAGPAGQDDPDLYLRIVAREADGVVIRGAKLHVSNCATVHEIVIMPTKRMRPEEADWAFAGALPVCWPGLRMVVTGHAAGDRDRGRFPWSARRSITEALVVFDDVFVPRERIFLAGEVEHSATWAHALGAWERIGALGHVVETADTLVGLAQLVAEANGIDRIAHVRAKIGDMAIYATMLRAGLEAALTAADVSEDGFATPNELFTNGTKYLAASEFSLMVRHLQDIAGGGVVTAPSSLDLSNPATHDPIAKYLRGAGGVDAEHRIRLFHAIRDLTADAYGGWRQVLLLLGGGGLHAQRLVASKHYDMDRARGLALEAAGLRQPEVAD